MQVVTINVVSATSNAVDSPMTVEECLPPAAARCVPMPGLAPGPGGAGGVGGGGSGGDVGGNSTSASRLTCAAEYVVDLLFHAVSCMLCAMCCVHMLCTWAVLQRVVAHPSIMRIEF